MMNRIRSLKNAGIAIALHYFTYNERGTPPELNEFCEEVHVYPRNARASGLSSRLPYIVSSRINDQMLAALRRDRDPVLLEGLHCTGILSGLDLSGRKIVVRMHNDESKYYRQLAHSERGLLRKLFFLRESRLLRNYSYNLPHECVYACISQADIKTLREKFGLPRTIFLPAFPNWQTVSGQEGVGSLCLYHGNLSVAENEAAAIWLLRRVFVKLKMPLVIAGKKPSRRLQKLAHLCQHTCLIPNPSEKQMDDLVRKAHINVLPSFSSEVTGIRLKLLHALYEGRHCVANRAMVEGTGLESACHIGNSADAFASIISQLSRHPFTHEEIRLRKELLETTYNNERNTEQLIQYLW